MRILNAVVALVDMDGRVIAICEDPDVLKIVAGIIETDAEIARLQEEDRKEDRLRRRFDREDRPGRRALGDPLARMKGGPWS